MSKLFSTIQEFKKYAVVNVSYDFGDIDPVLRIKEVALMRKKYLGKAQFDQLASAYASSSMTPEEEALLEEVRQPLSLVALAENQFTRYIQETPSGAHVVKDEHKMPASMLSMARRKSELMKNGYQAIDLLIDFLQENKADYPLWVNSEAYLEQKSLLISTTTQLARYLPVLPESHALYLQFRPIIRDREKAIQARIGKPFFDELKEQALNDTLTPANELVLVDFVRPALAFLSHEEAVSTLAKVHPFGIYVFEELNLDENAKVFETQLKYRDAMKGEYALKAITALTDLDNYLANNIDDYPTYRDSDAYTPPPEQEDTDADDPCASELGCYVQQAPTTKIGIL